MAGDPAELAAAVGRLEAENRSLRETRERERAELEALVARLRLSEERFSKAFQGSPDSVNLNRLSDGVYLAINRGFTRLTGYSEEEVLGRSSLEIDIWADPADRAQLVNGLREKGAVDDLPARFRLKDGRVHPGRMSARVIDVQGEPCILSITRDISAEVAAQEALRASEERLRMTIELAADGIVLLDARRRVQFVNRRGLELGGRREEDVVGRSVEEMLAPESVSRPLAFERLDRGEALVRELELLRPDGTRVPVEVNSRRMPDGTYQAVFRDLTERRLAERERSELQRRMDEVARVEAIGQLAAGIAHDFNNLLTPIMAAASTVSLAEGLSAEDRAGLKTIAEASSRAAELTRQILALGRRQLLRIEPLDVDAVVAKAVAMLRRVIREDVRIETVPCPALAVARADAGQVHQVVLNLAVNARDAMPEGGLLRISTSLFDVDETVAAQVPGLRPGCYVRIDMADEGVGMDAPTLARAFEPFFTTKEAGRGSGLGLASARGIAEQHGGWLWARSAVGRGSVFSFCLPRAEGEAPGSGLAEASTIPPLSRGWESVLLADDEPLVRAAARRALEACGYAVLASGSAEAVLRAAEGLVVAPTALVTDVVMPEMSGRALYERLRERYPSLRVLYISGYPDVLLPQEAARPEALLAKPFSTVALAASLRRVLDAG